MTSERRRLTDALVKMALLAVPPERRDWAEAMRAEAAHLPDSAAPLFAWGCLWASVRARAASSAFILRATQWVLVLGAICWSAGNLWLAGRLSDAGAELPTTIVHTSAAIYASGALLTALLGLRATVVLSAPVLMLAGLIAVRAEFLFAPSRYTDLYRALALEQFALLGVVVMIAAGIPKWVTAREAGSR